VFQIHLEAMEQPESPAQQHQQQHHQHVSKAERLSARWNSMFRADNNLLYDKLLWTSSDWPLPAVQWQTGSWQLPEALQELQQQAAADAEAEALAGYQLDEYDDADTAEDNLDDSDTEMHDASADGSAGSQRNRRNRIQNGNRQWFSGGKPILPMPLDFQYLLTGDQTGGQEAAHLVLWRVRLPGQLPAGFDAAAQQLAMMRGEIEPVLVSA
jgi:hypothetical protein